ncbi:MAG: hypothetical protein RLY43_1288 [Bacteroidota bacterium]|jgi:hypothetical protein
MKTTSNLSVLFVANNSNYLSLDCDCWTISRNALNFKASKPALYHPPCASWSRMRHFSKFVPGRHWLALWSLVRVRRYGGIIEHPFGSLFFKRYIVTPGSGYDKYGGFTILTDLHSFGAPYEKKTLLYFVGLKISELPSLPLNFDAITHCVDTSSSSSVLKVIPKDQRSITPLSMCEWLLSALSIIVNNKS